MVGNWNLSEKFAPVLQDDFLAGNVLLFFFFCFFFFFFFFFKIYLTNKKVIAENNGGINGHLLPWLGKKTPLTVTSRKCIHYLTYKSVVICLIS